MIEQILNKFGYYKARDIPEPSEEELSFALATLIGIQDTIDEDYENRIFADLKGTDGFVQYLRETAARDKDRYFGCTTKEEQLVVRGAFARTMFLRAKIMKSDVASS